MFVNEISHTSNWSISEYLPIPMGEEVEDKEDCQLEIEEKYEHIRQFAENFFSELEDLTKEKLDKFKELNASIVAIHISKSQVQEIFDEPKLEFGLEINRAGESYGLIKNRLAEGSFKQLNLAINLKTGRLYAHLKTRVEKNDEKEFEGKINALQREVNIQTLLQDSPVPKIVHSCLVMPKKRKGQHALKQFTLMEYCQKGDLYNHLSEKQSDVTQLDPSSPYWIVVKDVLEVLKLMQTQQIDHRDIKTENIFLTLDEQQVLRGRLGDFGLSCLTVNRSTQTPGCGTLEYVAPEIFEYVEYKIEVNQGLEFNREQIRAIKRHIRSCSRKEKKYDNNQLLEMVKELDQKLEKFKTKIVGEPERVLILDILKQKTMLLEKIESNNKALHSIASEIRQLQVDLQHFRQVRTNTKRLSKRRLNRILGNSKRDEWALGIVIYLIITQQGKSKNSLNRELYKISKEGADKDAAKLKARCEMLAGEPLQAMIQGLLSINPSERPSAAKCLQIMQRIEESHSSSSPAEKTC